MALAPNVPYNNQLLQDKYYVVTASAIGSATPSMDLIQATPFPTTRYIVLAASASSVTSVSQTSFTASFYVQDSADNNTFANVVALGPLAVTDSAGSGTGSAASISYQFPPNVRRYVRVSPVFSTGTDYTGSLNVSLKF